MDSAEGQVQNLRYTATFPLLLNVAEQPTYFMALKDASELVKMYAMVNVNQYQIVATGATVAECESNYRQMLRHARRAGRRAALRRRGCINHANMQKRRWIFSIAFCHASPQHDRKNSDVKHDMKE